MSIVIPKSMAGRTVMVLVIGLTVSHIASLIVFSDDRAHALGASDQQHMARHIASIAGIITNVPPDWRQKIVKASDDHAFRVFLSPDEEASREMPRDVRLSSFRTYLRNVIEADTEEGISVSIQETDEGFEQADSHGFAGWIREQVIRLVQGHDPDRVLLVSVPLADGQLLNFSTISSLSQTGWQRTVLIVGSFALTVLILASWAVRRLSMPLVTLAEAASFFGRDVRAPALPEIGSFEVREAIRAFNDMQGRLRRLIDNRTQMLAAVSHDLRTPLTVLRLRTESIEDSEFRRKMLATLQEMESMIVSTLEFARDDAGSEPREFADIASLVESVCDDLSDAGYAVVCHVVNRPSYQCRPMALKRALSNLVENAAKFGEKASVTALVTQRALEITVDDEGPGIPEKKIEEVFLPFCRVEQSRSRETGGIGLGLSVAQAVVDQHGGTLELRNRIGGGLRATVSLPL